MSSRSPDFRRLFESAPGLYLVLTPELEIVAASDAWLQATMTQREQITGRHIFDVFPDHPGDLSASLNRVLKDGAADTMTIHRYDVHRPESKGGDVEERYWSAVNSPVLRGDGSVEYLIHSIREVTDVVHRRRRRAEELRTREAAERRLRQVLEAVPEAIIECDAEGRIGLVNESAVRMFGYTREELVGLNVDMLVPESDRLVHARRRAEYARHPRMRPMGGELELSGRRKDGSYFPVEISLSPTSSDGFFKAIASVRDITDRRGAERQLELHRAQLLSSARLSALGMMAGGIGHEIGNPLAIIHASAADILHSIEEEGSAPLELVRHNCERIHQTANRISGIIRSLRALAREGSHDQMRPARVANIVEEAVEFCRDRFRLQSVDLLFPAIDSELSVLCREVQIVQVLLNLLQNAFDAASEHAEKKWVHLSVTVADPFVVFSVIDSGPGIPPDVKKRIMEPFFTTKEVGKGTGLGLSISRAVMKEHGGELELSEENGRTCFSFRLRRL